MEHALHNQYYAVEGVRCARCIHAIESMLHAEPAVRNARVNMSTNRLFVEWDGAEDLHTYFAQKVSALGYNATPFREPKKEKSYDSYLLRCAAIAGFAMGNIMLISAALWSTDQMAMGVATRDLLHWISGIIAIPTVAYAGQPFFCSALSVLSKGHTNMDVPISLALILALGMSVMETMESAEHAYFDSAVMLLFFLLIGRWLDARARQKARESAEALLGLMQGNATVLEAGGQTRSVPIDALREGMRVRISVGEKIPTDIRIEKGTSQIDTSLVTGESVPCEIALGDTAYGGTINLDTPIEGVVLKASQDSLLADIIRLMEQAEQGRARYVHLADRAAKLYTPVVHSLALCAFVGWMWLGHAPWQDALLIAITTLIITCPCALGLAVPVVQVLTTGALLKRGIMVKSGDALERISGIDTVVFDKTGTLTKGVPVLLGKHPQTILQQAASLASHSQHPYSRAIASAYDDERIEMGNVQELAGMGIEGTYEGAQVKLIRSDDSARGQVMWCAEGDEPHYFFFEDALREDAKEAVQACKANGLNVVMLSGDNERIVSAMAQILGIEQWKAGCLPNEKIAHVQQLQQQGHKVLMVGDGLNDAPALAQADASISPASGMDIAQNSADMVMQGEKLMTIVQSWKTACFSTRLVKQNFALATAYNCIAIPLAVAGYVTPLIAAISMSASSVIVIANSFRIRKG